MPRMNMELVTFDELTPEQQALARRGLADAIKRGRIAHISPPGTPATEIAEGLLEGWFHIEEDGPIVYVDLALLFED